MQRDDTYKWYAKFRDQTPCACCGLKAGAALEFHHVKPHEKRFTIAQAIYKDYSLDLIRSELDKCIPLCSNCHKIAHTNGVLDFSSQANWNREEAAKSQIAVVAAYWKSRGR